MDEYLEIETILNEMDFSKGRQEAIWKKIKSRIKNDAATTLSNTEDLGCEDVTLKNTPKEKRLPLHREL